MNFYLVNIFFLKCFLLAKTNIYTGNIEFNKAKGKRNILTSYKSNFLVLFFGNWYHDKNHKCIIREHVNLVQHPINNIPIFYVHKIEERLPCRIFLYLSLRILFSTEHGFQSNTGRFSETIKNTLHSIPLGT